MARRMTNEEVRAILEDEIRTSVGYHSTELANQRTKALEYFYGELFGNEVEGRSEYVSPDVRDTILWIMPSLMRIFTGGDEIVRFEPQGPEDEQSADQATDYCNYVFSRQNDGFLVLHTWFMDALLSKNGFVKVYWEEKEEPRTDTYENLTDDEFAFMLKDGDTDIIEHTEEPVPGTPLRFHSVKLRSKKKSTKCEIVPVPPEEILVNRYPIAPLSKNRFICHRRRVRIAELKAMGYEDVDDLTSYGETQDFNQERIARYSYDETDSSRDQSVDPNNRYVWLAECYTEMDVDGDGIAEKRTITLAGDRLLENVEGFSSRICTLTPIPLPHKLYGMSIADLVMDLQLLKSAIFRNIMDNIYLANNGRWMALDGMVNIDDLLTARPGGVVRVKTFDAVKPLQPPLLGAPAFEILGYLDTVKDSRTGVNKDLQGLDPQTLNHTATAQSNRLASAQQRIELIARIFAETGVKDLFYAILEVIQKHQNAPQVIRLRNQWVTMDPREWDKKFDMTVSVGLGTGSKDSIIGGLLETLKLQLASLQSRLPIVTPKNVYHTALELLKAQSIKSGDLFFTDPDAMPPQQPVMDPAMVDLKMKEMDGQIKGQLQEMKHQASIEKQQLRDSFDAEKTKFQASVEMAKLERERAHDADEREHEHGMQMQQSREQHMMDADAQMRQSAADKDKMRFEKDTEAEMSFVDMLWQLKQREEDAKNQQKQAETQAILDAISRNHEHQNTMMQKLLEASLAPEEIVRDDKGKVKGKRKIMPNKEAQT